MKHFGPKLGPYVQVQCRALGAYPVQSSGRKCDPRRCFDFAALVQQKTAARFPPLRSVSYRRITGSRCGRPCRGAGRHVRPYRPLRLCSAPGRELPVFVSLYRRFDQPYNYFLVWLFVWLVS